MSDFVVDIKGKFGNTLDTRDGTTRLMQLIQSAYPSVNDISLDLRGVDFMSRSFAEQFYNEQQRSANATRLQIVNADTQIIEIMAAVSKTKRNERQFIEYPVYAFDDYDALMDYLQGI